MREAITLLLCASIVAMSLIEGCSCKSRPNPHHKRGKNGGELFYDPHLNLKWPGWPGGDRVSMRGMVPTDEADLMWSARGWSKHKGDALVFEAIVREFCAASLRGKSDHDVLEWPLRGYVLLSEKIVTEHGPNKYPALEVTAQSAKKEYVRFRIVYAKPTLYVVSVISSVREDLGTTEVVEFLDSFAVTSADTELNREESFSTGW